MAWDAELQSLKTQVIDTRPIDLTTDAPDPEVAMSVFRDALKAELRRLLHKH